MIMEIASRVVLLLFLAAAAYEDWKTGELSILLIGAGGIAGIVYQVVVKKASATELTAGAAVGFMLLLIAFASRQGIGYGDGFLMMAAGIFLGGTRCILLLLYALLLSLLYVVLMRLCRQKQWKDRIVFAPFLLSGYLLLEGLGG